MDEKIICRECWDEEDILTPVMRHQHWKITISDHPIRCHMCGLEVDSGSMIFRLVELARPEYQVREITI